VTVLHHRAFGVFAGFGSLDAGEFLFQFRNAAIGQFAGALVFAAALRLREFAAQLVEFGLEFLGVGKFFLFRLPTRGDIGGLLFQRFEFSLQPLEAVLGTGVLFLLERLLLDLEPHDFAVDRVEFLGFGIDLHLEPRRRLVDQIDGLVRQKTVGDVAVRQGGSGNDRAVANADAVMLFVFILEAAQDRDGVFDRRFRYEDRLEAARQRGVFFDVLFIFVERGSADAMQFAAGQRRFQQVGRIHCAIGFAGADERVHLVDEQNDAALGRGDFVEHGLEPLLKFAAIFSASNKRAEIEREQFLVLQAFRHVAIDDAQRKALDDGGLADAGFADQHRIVLGTAREHLDGAADFLVASNDRVELAVARGLRQIAGIFLERVIGIFGRSRVGGAALAQRIDGSVDILWRDAGLGQNLTGLAVFFQRQREQ